MCLEITLFKSYDIHLNSILSPFLDLDDSLQEIVHKVDLLLDKTSGR